MDAVSKCRHDDPINCCELFLHTLITMHRCVHGQKIILYHSFLRQTISRIYFIHFSIDFIPLLHTQISVNFLPDFHVTHYCPEFNNKK